MLLFALMQTEQSKCDEPINDGIFAVLFAVCVQRSTCSAFLALLTCTALTYSSTANHNCCHELARLDAFSCNEARGRRNNVQAQPNPTQPARRFRSTCTNGRTRTHPSTHTHARTHTHTQPIPTQPNAPTVFGRELSRDERRTGHRQLYHETLSIRIQVCNYKPHTHSFAHSRTHMQVRCSVHRTEVLPGELTRTHTHAGPTLCSLN